MRKAVLLLVLFLGAALLSFASANEIVPSSDEIPMDDSGFQPAEGSEEQQFQEPQPSVPQPQGDLGEVNPEEEQTDPSAIAANENDNGAAPATEEGFLKRTWNKAADATVHYGSKALDGAKVAYGHTKEFAGKAYDKGKVLAGEAYDKGKVLAGEAYEKGKVLAGHAYEKGKVLAGHAYEKGKVLAGHAYEKGKVLAGQAYEKGKVLAGDAVEGGKKLAIGAHRRLSNLRKKQDADPSADLQNQKFSRTNRPTDEQRAALRAQRPERRALKKQAKQERVANFQKNQPLKQQQQQKQQQKLAAKGMTSPPPSGRRNAPQAPPAANQKFSKTNQPTAQQRQELRAQRPVVKAAKAEAKRQRVERSKTKPQQAPPQQKNKAGNPKNRR